MNVTDEFLTDMSLIIETSNGKMEDESDGPIPKNPGETIYHFDSDSNSLVIDGDVNITTGDIVFSGKVNIKGSVRTGYAVKAGAGIRIGGVVEAAELETSGDIILDSGIRGANKAVINAGGSVQATFLEGCTVTANGDILADSILHCQVNCGGSILLNGRYGVLIGGKAAAGKSIEAQTIGSAASAHTEVYVGHNPEKLHKYQQLFDEYEKTIKRYNENNLAINTLRARASLHEERKKSLIDSLHTKFMLREKLKDLRKEFDSILPEMKTHDGIIKVRLKVHFGVKAMIGNAVIYIRDELAGCVLTNVNGKIHIGLKN